MTQSTDSSLGPLAARIVEEAQESGLTLATAESCTAGALAALIASAPGAGKCFHGGFVVYTKENKIKALGVSEALLARHSAVSAETAQAMALGALERCPADVVVAITGVAGPEPDEDGNPVGLVYVAAARRDGLVRHEEHRLGERTKQEICGAASVQALTLLERVIRE